MKFFNRICAVLMLLVGSLIVPKDARAYDMDCAVILCLAGGFPPGCGAAYSYMIDRITARPPKPPFGFCAMGSLEDVDFPNNEDPAAYAAMLREINEDSVITTLQSVRAEIFRGYRMCDGPAETQIRCTNMIGLDGDGGNYFRGIDWNNGWRRGERVLFVDHEGNQKAIGDAEAYIVVDQECSWISNEYECIDIYDWRPIATPASEYNPLEE